MSADAMIARKGKEVTVKRYEASTIDHGRFVSGAETEFTAIISVQPVTGRELLNLPEAQRTKGVLKGYTVTELKTADETGKTKADVVVYKGKNYEVQTVEDWGEGDLQHYKVLLVEENPS